MRPWNPTFIFVIGLSLLAGCAQTPHAAAPVAVAVDPYLVICSHCRAVADGHRRAKAADRAALIPQLHRMAASWSVM